jgi:O-antigen/teichoic acid export membrane protein
VIDRCQSKAEATIRRSRAFADVQDLRNDLAGRSIRGGSSLVVSEIGCNIFRLLGTVILARLLTPEHFGLIGMVTALTAFAEMFKDLGLGTATIQQKEITHEQISTLFWVNAGVGVAIMLILAGAAPLISWFYGDTRLFWVAIAISSTFLFGGLTVQHQALLRRQMQFPLLAFIQVLSTALSTIIGILLAWQGFEYWALVWKEVSRAVIQASATWLLSHWLPGLPMRGTGVRTMFQIGSHVTGFNILTFASGGLDQVLLGKFWGAGPLGLYRQASLLLMLPVSLFSYPITYVMTPALSALQSDPERYRSYYRRVVSFLAFGYMPLIAYIAVYSDNLIALVLGDKWMASSPVLQILALGAIVSPIAGTCGIVMVTNGRTKEYLHVGVAQAIFLSLAVCIGINWGLIGVAIACAAYTLFSLPLLVWFSFKETPISQRLFYEALWFPALTSGIMGLFLITLRHLLEVPNAFLEIVYSALLAPLLYCSVWLLLPGGKQNLIEYFSYFRLALDEITSRVWSPALPKVFR